jgi:hypothetical protein
MSLDGDLPSPDVPPGFRLRQVEPDDADRRAQVHRAAFHPSRVSGESYRNVMAAWPHRPDLDLVIEAPDGRLGLARAVSLGVLQALRAASAAQAVVYPRGDDDYPVPARLYGSLGFTPRARTVTYAR